METGKTSPGNSKKVLTRTIIILSLVSLFTDAASEMLYPVMPSYLKTIGFSALLIGILEGLAEAIAGLSKGYFGRLSDRTGQRALFVQVGYSLSAISKPLLAIFKYPLWVFFSRTLDRMGKGIRTGARDAILSSETTKENKGKVFGFHRALDTMGAVIGPSLALLYLLYYPGDYHSLFLIAIIPGALSILLTFTLKSKIIVKPEKKKVGLFSFFSYWKESPLQYRRVVVGILVFTLFNSTDLFLLLKMKQSGFDDTSVIGAYIFYNIVFALTAFPMGILGDKIGLRNTFVIGMILFSITYFGFAFSNSLPFLIALLVVYGMFAAATDGVSKAWITNISSDKDTATAVGTMTAFQSLVIMLANFLAGGIWLGFGPEVMFIISASVAIVVAGYFLLRPGDKA